jgi:hypothetical protein
MLLGVLFAFTFGAAGSAHAWGNGGYSSNTAEPDYGTHDWIAEASLRIQSGNVSFLSTHHSMFLLGTEAPDNPQYIGDTTEHHVYFRASGLLQDDSAGIRAREMYLAALSDLEAEEWEQAAFKVGAMTHYIADMGVFGHTMGAGTDWGSESVHQDYEEAVNADIVNMDFPTSLPLGDEDAYNATIDLARKTTFGSGSTMANTWMDDNYDWASATYRSYAFASVDDAVRSVAAAINHLVKDATLEPPQQDGTPSPDDDKPEQKDQTLLAAGIVAAVAAVVTAAVVIARSISRR